MHILYGRRYNSATVEGAEMPDDASLRAMLQRVQQRGGDYVESFRGNCAQGALYALSEEASGQPASRFDPLMSLATNTKFGADRGSRCECSEQEKPRIAHAYALLPATHEQEVVFCCSI